MAKSAAVFAQFLCHKSTDHSLSCPRVRMCLSGPRGPWAAGMSHEGARCHQAGSCWEGPLGG